MSGQESGFPQTENQYASRVGEFSLGALLRPLRAFWEPAKVFEEIAGKPTLFWVLLLQAAMVLGVQWVVAPRLDMEATILQSMEQRGQQISPERLAEAVQGAQRFSKVRLVLSPLASVAIMALLAGLYFLAAKAAGSDAEYKPLFSAIAHASFPPSLVASAVFAVVASTRRSFAAQEIPRLVKSSLAAWLPEGVPAFFRGLAGVVDVFNVWYWVLLVMALVTVGGLRRSQAVGIVALFWGIWAVLQGIAAGLWG